MTYKGYSARPEYSAEDGVFFGRLLGINDLVNFESANAEGLEEEFHKAVGRLSGVLLRNREAAPDAHHLRIRERLQNAARRS